MIKTPEKRRVFVTLMSWLLMGQLLWVIFLSSDFHHTIFGETKQPRATSANDRDSLSGVNSSLSAVDEAFLDLFGPSDKRLAIFRGEYDLVWIGATGNVTAADGSSYQGVTASFCPLNWKTQKKEPNTVPRYRNVYENKICNKNELAEVEFDLADLMKMIRHYDRLVPSEAKQLDQAGLIFHESRCGSTLVANMLTVANPDTTRVYSEPHPLLRAMKTGNKQLVEDVMFLMSRTTKSSREKRVFYKLKSDAVRHIEVMPEDIPWIFLYRKPEEVMASHFNPTEHVSTAVCASEQKKDDPPPFIEEISSDVGMHYKEMPKETFCAVRLASLCLAAIRQHERTGKGRFVNYKTLPASLWESFGPEHFGLNFSARGVARMKSISSVYSKGHGDEELTKWKKKDDKAKVKLVTKEQEEAAHDVLRPYFDQMEELAKERL